MFLHNIKYFRIISNQCLTVCSYHVTYAFESDSIPYICLNIKELLAWNRHNILSFKIQTHNHLVCKGTLNHLAKLAKWFSCVVSTYLYGAFDLMFLSCHICISKQIYLVILPLFPAMSSLTFRQLYSVDSQWNIYMTWYEHTVKCTIQISTHKTAQSFH